MAEPLTEVEREELTQLRIIVDGMDGRMRAVVAHFIQESRIKTMEQEIFALNDGLRGWKETAKQAEDRAKKLEVYETILREVSAAVDEVDLFDGTLPERLRAAIKTARAADELRRRP